LYVRASESVPPCIEAVCHVHRLTGFLASASLVGMTVLFSSGYGAVRLSAMKAS
jgi:hypothetical protein